MANLSAEHVDSIVQAILPGHRLVSSERASASFTNDAIILECSTPAGNRIKLAVKLLVDEPVDAPRCAAASYHAMLLARAHGVPVPEPIYLDETGSVLGAPGIVTRFVEGKQWSDRLDPVAWAATFARILLKIHDINPGPEDRKLLLDGNHESMYFLRADQPKSKAGHPLSDVIYDTVTAYRPSVPQVTTSLVHLDYWPGNVLWHEGQVTAILDWDFASYGDPALDVAYFRMDMHLRGIKEAAEPFLECYEAESGTAVKNLGFWELAAAAHPLPNPVTWIPASREMGDDAANDERGETGFAEFVHDAVRRTHAGR